MDTLHFRCPNTNKSASAGAETDVNRLARRWNDMVSVECPHCSKVHQVRFRDAYIEGTVQRLSDAGGQAFAERALERLNASRAGKGP